MKVLAGQSIIDIAIQTTGSAASAYGLAAANAISVTDELQPGQTISAVNIVNKNIMEYYDARNIRSGTASVVESAPIERVFFEELPIEFT